jgi:hypothetical protein
VELVGAPYIGIDTCELLAYVFMHLEDHLLFRDGYRGVFLRSMLHMKKTSGYLHELGASSWKAHMWRHYCMHCLVYWNAHHSVISLLFDKAFDMVSTIWKAPLSYCYFWRLFHNYSNILLLFEL